MQADINKGITSINNLLLTVGMSLKGYKLLTNNASMENMNATLFPYPYEKEVYSSVLLEYFRRRDEAKTQYCREWAFIDKKINKLKLPGRGKAGPLAR